MIARPVIPITTLLDPVPPGHIPGLLGRPDNQTHTQAKPRKLAVGTGRIAQQTDDTSQRVHLRLPQRRIIKDSQRKITLMLKVKRLDQSMILFSQIQPVIGHVLGIQGTSDAGHLRLGKIALQHSHQARAVLAAQAVVHHAVVGIQLKRQSLILSPDTPQKILHGGQRPTTVGGADYAIHRGFRLQTARTEQPAQTSRTRH